MTEDLKIAGGTREEKYKELLPQVSALINGENDPIANMANLCAAIKQTMDFLWVGFYLVKDDQLVLGPFQGPVACTRIARGKGVCGAAWEKKETIIVPDVDLFPGHISCSSLSKSEIVIPCFDSDHKVAGVLDVDSAETNCFDETDKYYLTALVRLLIF